MKKKKHNVSHHKSRIVLFALLFVSTTLYGYYTYNYSGKKYTVVEHKSQSQQQAADINTKKEEPINQSSDVIYDLAKLPKYINKSIWVIATVTNNNIQDLYGDTATASGKLEMYNGKTIVAKATPRNHKKITIENVVDTLHAPTRTEIYNTFKSSIPAKPCRECSHSNPLHCLKKHRIDNELKVKITNNTLTQAIIIYRLYSSDMPIYEIGYDLKTGKITPDYTKSHVDASKKLNCSDDSIQSPPDPIINTFGVDESDTRFIGDE